MIILFFTLIFIGIYVLVSAIWFKNNFGKIPFEQLLFHMRMPIATGDLSAISDYFLATLPITIGITAIVFLFLSNLEIVN
ncbi:MAG: hypothetical protein ACOYCB_09795 [Fastidiosipilaceae bacterium]|jgi:phosphoglycerol transferase